MFPQEKKTPSQWLLHYLATGGTFRDTRLQLEDRTTGPPHLPTPALPKTLHWQLIPCFLPYYWHDTTIPGDTQSCIALEILQVSRDTQGQRRLSCLLCSCKRRKRNNLCALPPPPPPVLQEHVFHKMVIGYHKRCQVFTAVIHPRRCSILPSQEIRRYPSGRCTKSSRLPICHPVR